MNKARNAGISRAKLSIDEVDQLVSSVAELLPFPVTLDADMGGAWTLQIYFGREVDRFTGRPVHRAGIDADEKGAVWWLDFDGGARQELSDLDGSTSPEQVAAWIAVHSGMGE